MAALKRLLALLHGCGGPRPFRAFGARQAMLRHRIRARTGEGRERAKARGVRMGRPPKLTSHQQREAIRRRDRDGDTLAEIARSYNVSAATISRLAAV